MALTLSNMWQSKTNTKDCVDFDVAFDSSYPRGGESFATLQNIGRVQGGYVAQVGGNYKIELDLANQKLKVYMKAPIDVFEELVTVTANVGYLRWPAAHINYITGITAVPAYVTCQPIAGGVTPATGQCAVDLGYNDTTGVLTKDSRTSLTFLSTDVITTARVSYVTQAWIEVQDNMEMCKVLGVSSDVGSKVYGNAAMVDDPIVDADQLRIGCELIAVQSITWSDGGDAGTIKAPAILAAATAPGATNRSGIDFEQATVFAEITAHADTMLQMVATDLVRVVYIKKPTSGQLSDGFVNATIADATDVIIFTGHHPLLYGHCGQLPMTTAGKICRLVPAADTPAAGEGNWTVRPGCGAASQPSVTMEGATDDDAVPAWVNIPLDEIETQMLQAPEGEDLSGLTGVHVHLEGI